MSFANPTPLRIGMPGTFSGQRFRILGRVVLGVVEDGETYYWNEFNLQNDAGASATLVFEQTDLGGQWRWFTLFEPDYPISAQDAASKRVGDPLNLDGTDVRVTLLEESRVYHIEGQAPEGVEVGDVARYFNAEAGSAMYVVSWTGDEVEVFRGATIPHPVVAAAFNLPAGALNSLAAATLTPTSSSSPPALKIVMALFSIGTVAALFFSCIPHRSSPALTKISAPPSPLTVGWSGRLDDRPLKIIGHAAVQVSQVGVILDRHEFNLRDDNSNDALLVQSWAPGSTDWALFTPLQPLEPLSPAQAAALRWGESVNIDGIEARVCQIFRSTPHTSSQPELELVVGGDLFGFVAQTPDNSTLLMARWNANSISFYKGKTLPAAKAAAAFKP